MIFKVLYQPHEHATPVRERTKSMYIEAKSEREIRSKLNKKTINIELIQALDKAHLAYEQKSNNFQVKSL